MRPGVILAGRAAIVVASGAATVLVSGCGASTSRRGASTAGGRSPLALAQCMRAHGVSNFPDPITGPGGQGFTVSMTPGSDSVSVNGIAFGGPAFTAAERTCHFGPGGSRPPIGASQKRKLLAFARCMRANGISNWADPKYPPGGGIELGGPAKASAQDSPAIERAAQKCNRAVGL